MKRVIYCFMIGIMGLISQAQQNRITQAEYFWDTDPGEGSATAITAADGNFDEVLETVLQNTATIPATAGFHTFGIRLKDNTGVWGPVFRNVVHTGNPNVANYATVAEAEYFWDTDPGEGNGTALNAEDGNFNSVLESVMQNTTSLPADTGLHKFGFRIKDNSGVWGPAFINIVHTGTPATISYQTLEEAEYFWDTDPGEGNGIPLPAADGSFNNVIENILKSDINIVNPLGFHRINVRVKDNQGVWGPVFVNVIYNENVLSVDPHNTAENYYFIPNPATSVIRFNKDIQSVVVVDLNGRQITASVSNSNEVNIEGLAIGTYILKVTTPEGLTFNKKMIKR